MELIQVSPGKVKILNNIRKTINKAGINELAKSIKENGLQEPITIRKGKGRTFELITGQRRLLASRIAKLNKIPALLQEVDDRHIAVKQLVENEHREAMDIIEVAQAYIQMYHNDAMTIKEISIKTGKSIVDVKRFLAIEKMTKEVKKQYQSGNLEFEKALILAKFEPDIQKYIIDNARNLLYGSIKNLEKNIIEQFSGDLSKAKFDLTDETLNPEMGACTNCPMRTINNKDLFDTKDDRCGKLECYNTKTTQHCLVIIGEYEKTEKKLILLNNFYGKEVAEFGGRKVFGLDEIEPAKSSKEATVNVYDALIVYGNGVGEKIKVMLKSDIKKIEKKEREELFKKGNEKKIKEELGYVQTPDSKLKNKINRINDEYNYEYIQNLICELETINYMPTDEQAFLFLQMALYAANYDFNQRFKKHLKIESTEDKKKFFKACQNHSVIFNTFLKSLFYENTIDISADDFKYKIVEATALSNGVKINPIREEIEKLKKPLIDELKEKFVTRWGREPNLDN